MAVAEGGCLTLLRRAAQEGWVAGHVPLGLTRL